MPHDAFKLIDAGLALPVTACAAQQPPYGAQTYHWAGFMMVEVAKGLATIASLPVRDQKLIKAFVEKSFEGVDRTQSLAISTESEIRLKSDENGRILTANDGRVMAYIVGSGYDAKVTINLAKDFIVSGSTQLTHADAEGVQRFLIKTWSPVEVLTSAIGLLVSGNWSFP